MHSRKVHSSSFPKPQVSLALLMNGAAELAALLRLRATKADVPPLLLLNVAWELEALSRVLATEVVAAAAIHSQSP